MPEIQLRQQQSLAINPKLFAANRIMQLSAVEIEQAILQEINANPALEMIEHQDCPVCGSILQFGFCGQCYNTDLFMSDQILRPLEKNLDDHTDFLGLVPAPLSLPEHIFGQLRLVLDGRDHEIALYLAGNLDEHGYLELSLEEIAQTFHTELRRVEAILRELQQLEPVGIGARNVCECLLLQVEWLDLHGADVPSGTRAIIANHLEALGHHQFERISCDLKMKREDIEKAFLFIRKSLHPYPAYRYYSAFSATNDPFIEKPSILICTDRTSVYGYEVEVVESHQFTLYLNPLYQALNQSHGSSLTTTEHNHIIHYLERARLFLSHLRRRKLLLKRIAEYVVEYQQAFLDDGPLYLRHLTQETVAQAVGVHVSTISRAISNKFVQLPTHHIVPLNRLFSGEQRTLEHIRQIIMNEADVLSDANISQILHNRHGITLSRQMVANYRCGLGIAPARQRAVLRRSGGNVHGC